MALSIHDLLQNSQTVQGDSSQSNDGKSADSSERINQSIPQTSNDTYENSANSVYYGDVKDDSPEPEDGYKIAVAWPNPYLMV